MAIYSDKERLQERQDEMKWRQERLKEVRQLEKIAARKEKRVDFSTLKSSS
jgi:hypothetical protein